MAMPHGDAFFYRASPFALLADVEAAACWAGRPEVHKHLDKICRACARRRDSSIDVIWANFGAGKTHALLHLAHMFVANYGDQVKSLTAFVEMPENLTSFLVLYRRIMAALPTQMLETCLSQADDRVGNHNLRRAATALAHGGQVEKALAREWLLGKRPYLRDLKNLVSIDARIESDVMACDILGDVVGICGRQGIRVVILLDEFQRIGVLPLRKREPILSNVRSVFSHNSTFFSMVVAVSSRVERTAMKLIPAELRTLLGMRPVIALPEMSPQEAAQYIRERLQFFRPSDYAGSNEAPFSAEALNALVDFVHTHDKAKMIPRTLHKALAITSDAIIDSPTQSISPEKITQMLGALNWDIPEE